MRYTLPAPARMVKRTHATKSPRQRETTTIAGAMRNMRISCPSKPGAARRSVHRAWSSALAAGIVSALPRNVLTGSGDEC